MPYEIRRRTFGKSKSLSEFVYFVKRPNTLKEPKLERHLFRALTFVLILPSGEQLWVKTIQGYWLLSLGNLLRQKRATISLVTVITLETFKEL